MQICDPVLRYRKSGFFYNGRIFRGKSFCLVNNKKLTKITGGIISLRFYLKVKCNEQGEIAKEQNETNYEWYVENNPQEGDLAGAIYEGIAKFLNGLDDAERAEVLYDVYAANVYQNGNGEDEQGRVLHRMFDQVIIENVSFK